MKIDTEILNIIARGRVEKNLYYLPPGQLDRKIYTKVNDVLTSLGGAWKTKLKAHLFNDDIEEKLDEIINTGEYESLKQKKNDLQYFPTPKNIVSQMIELAELKEDNYVLETSVGTGNIAEEIYKISTNLDIHDIDEKNALIAKNKCPMSRLTIGDFLEMEVNCKYDKIIQNPPFHIKGRAQCDVDFILHAWEFLVKSGILVSIVSESPFFRSNNKSEQFRQWLEENNAEIIKLPEGAFTESQTNVKTRIIKIVKN